MLICDTSMFHMLTRPVKFSMSVLSSHTYCASLMVKSDCSAYVGAGSAASARTAPAMARRKSGIFRMWFKAPP